MYAVFHLSQYQNIICVICSRQHIFYVLQVSNSHKLPIFIMTNMLLTSGTASNLHLLLTFSVIYTSIFAILDLFLQTSVA